MLCHVVPTPACFFEIERSYELKASFTAQEPGQIEYTLTMTMRLDEWAQLSGQLSEKYPSWKLSSVISDMVYQAKSKFIPTESKV